MGEMDNEDRAVFCALQNLDFESLEGKDIMTVLPFLAKLLLNSSFVRHHELFALLYPIGRMNDIINYLQARNIETFDPNTIPAASTFESASSYDKLRIIAAEYIKIQDRVRQLGFTPNNNAKLLPSELLDNPIYVDEISYCLCALLIKPTMIPVINILDMSEALIYVKFGSTYIFRMVANNPDRCLEVCQSLINFGERQDEGVNFNEISEQRAKTLRMLCRMNPSIAFTVRSVTLQLCKMPSLTIMITSDHLNDALDKYDSIVKDENGDDSHECMEIEESNEVVSALKDLEESYESAVAFITGILLGVDEATKAWFSQYTKSAQQKRIDQGHHSVLSTFRYQILAYMNRLFPVFLEENVNSDAQLTDDSTQDESINVIKTKANTREMNKKLIRATATLRIFCALRGIGSLKLNQEESEIILRLVTSKPPVNQTSVNFATTGVCTLLACSVLINNQKDEKRAAEWLKWLIKESNYSDHRFSSHGRCSISELLLLIAIHFQNNQTNQIAELVSATLGMKLQIKASVSKCKSLFVQEVFNEQMVAEHAVKVPVTKGLNNNIAEFLPVHCIHQLLESRSFSKHQVPIREWIYQQICESKKPIHHILPTLIEAYVNSVIISTSAHGHCGTNQPIPEEDLARIFRYQLYSKSRDVDNEDVSNCNLNGSIDQVRENSSTNTSLVRMDACDDETELVSESPNIVDVEAAQVLSLYYLVLYEDVRLRKYPDLSATERTQLIKYSPDFMMDIPVFYLLQLVRDNRESFATILPSLLKLVTSQYPHLCSIQHWISTEQYEPNCSVADNYLSNGTTILSSPRRSSSNYIPLSTPKKSVDNLSKQLTDAFHGIISDSQHLTRLINVLLALPKEEIWPYVNLFIDNLSKVINLEVTDSQDYKKLISATTKLWWRFNSIFPRKLWVMTVNSLKRPQIVKSTIDVKPVEYSWDELALDPLIVLRCDSRVFRCEQTLNILLHILNAFLAASRRCLHDQMNEKPTRQKEVSFEELRTTLILAQTSAAIQILLEFCLPSEGEQEALNKRESNCDLSPKEIMLLERFNSSVNCICQHLHQVFIADTNLAKLVHFQTYPSELLATTSERIPSMHICLDFIPELLAQPDLSKQVFVIELTSHLCEKYAITKSLNVAKLCFNVAYTLLQLLPSGRRALFFIPVLPALLKICSIFPILREDAEIILTQINQVTVAHMASTSSRLSLGSSRPFEGLEKMNWREVKKLMDTLSLQEALYLCIQKCSMNISLGLEISCLS